MERVNRALEVVILKTLAGFMNTSGGSLLIGVSDDGKILGLEPDYSTLSRKDSDGFTQLIMSTIAEKMGAPACRLVKILFHMHEGKEICRLIVLPSPVPLYLNDGNQPHFFVRKGSGTRALNVQEAITFIKAKWG
jgi:predicted HTH transcriptional regulator